MKMSRFRKSKTDGRTQNVRNVCFGTSQTNPDAGVASHDEKEMNFVLVVLSLENNLDWPLPLRADEAEGDEARPIC